MSYFKPNTKKAIKIAIAIKGLTATIATATVIMANPIYSLIVVGIGGIANETINFLSNAEDPNSKI